MVDLTALKDAAEWSRARKEILEAVKDVIGQRASNTTDLQLNVVDEDDFPNYVRKRVNYFVDEWTRISAWLFVPNEREEMPAVLCCHQECRQGKNEPAGLEGNGRMAFATHYAERGYITLAPDCITAGERVSSRLQAWDPSLFYADHPQVSLLGKMLDDHARALDVLERERLVDPARIGVIGHGIGGTNALLLAALDGRVQCCVASCGFTRFSTDSGVDRWFKFLPGLKSAAESGEYPFDWEHVLALAAPSAVLAITAIGGSGQANPESCAEAVAQVERLYKFVGAPRAIEHFMHDDGDQMTFETLDMADDWFERWL
ncbi:MAG: dienelactone hydrolase family protein [Candidatus Hydrogenedentes bacterium]|nr:dienelactone hydrolase family protein [Candidatus Hydrogenedentota bacterium]